MSTAGVIATLIGFGAAASAYGQFTTRAMLNHAPPDYAQDMLRALWPNPLPEKH